MRGSLVGTAVTLAAGALLTAAMPTASASPPGGTAEAASTPATASPSVPASAPVAEPAPRPVLVDCAWARHVRPTDFILACGDGNSVLTHLNWTKWTDSGAVAEGMNAVNDCKPYCAAGTFHSYPVTVRLDRPEPWKKDPDVTHFTRMSLTYSDARPDGFTQVKTYPLWN
ncbi:hypothetical protein ACGFYV_02965 [Streptomyces sp. NPDC048297]|uniref:hypothetical protein n=1 Tax=Streptomyces sp. NPDC048297 TaxID=3365531 RepID=UPI0037117ED0